MNILILDSWLREHLITKASPKKIAECLTLSGPSVDRLIKHGKDYIYDIEITTNRVDAMSVAGIAREATAILPQFGIKAKYKNKKTFKITSRNKLDIKITNNPKLCKRILAVKIENVSLGESPKWMQERLESVGQRSLNNAIDITNYVMWEIGHPIHAFDYDKLTEKKIIVREAKKGEVLKTLDNKKIKLKGGEVVFDNGKGEIIDLPGIMGTANTVVDKNTKNILLWIESIDPVRIRRASMDHSIRSQAAVLNEKHVDPELGLVAILRASQLYIDICKVKIASKLVDIYPKKPKKHTVKTDIDFINERLGIKLTKIQIKKILESLLLKPKWQGNNITCEIPSFRIHDISIPEDILEEVARIYGYHNLPSKLMAGELPEPNYITNFNFEYKIKNILKAFGGNEVYTFSLVGENMIKNNNALELLNPLGEDSRYLRTTLKYSLLEAVNTNSHEDKPFHLFEIANIYIPRKGDLPNEKMMLAGIFSNYKYQNAKGIIESLLEELNIKNININLEKLNKDIIYYEFEISELLKNSKKITTYKPLPKFPAQIEDITFELPPQTYIGDVITLISKTDLVTEVELNNIYKNSYTFRVNYQHPEKTLTDNEVERIRNKIILNITNSFGGKVK